ncbi:hypothetical protein WICMUC_000779 [Wickerhamomyces mucosus]|uniref:Uncharacterized protein n=1 Tax=Wickerhamomyces mucosus TaxID=1378264 RepID=A0A9P8TI56_9ASCO|nr:hypothetical protein WICMUC_000779 [Wickerhamomyces mucosus]
MSFKLNVNELLAAGTQDVRRFELNETHIPDRNMTGIYYIFQDNIKTCHDFETHISSTISELRDEQYRNSLPISRISERVYDRIIQYKDNPLYLNELTRVISLDDIDGVEVTLISEEVKLFGKDGVFKDTMHFISILDTESNLSVGQNQFSFSFLSSKLDSNFIIENYSTSIKNLFSQYHQDFITGNEKVSRGWAFLFYSLQSYSNFEMLNGRLTTKENGNINNPIIDMDTLDVKEIQIFELLKLFSDKRMEIIEESFIGGFSSEFFQEFRALKETQVFNHATIEYCYTKWSHNKTTIAERKEVKRKFKLKVTGFVVASSLTVAMILVMRYY